MFMHRRNSMALFCFFLTGICCFDPQPKPTSLKGPVAEEMFFLWF
jgi:hypothetical protein